jgi:hypothetical protein
MRKGEFKLPKELHADIAIVGGSTGGCTAALKAVARPDPNMNPGNGYESRLCHEPKAAIGVFKSIGSL